MDRGSSCADLDEQSKIKTQNSSGSSAGALAISSISAGGSADSPGAPASTSMANSVSVGTSNLVDVTGVSSDLSQPKSNNNITSAGQKLEGNDVDEDGYSIQPPKEVAWEDTNEHGRGLINYSICICANKIIMILSWKFLLRF